MFDAQNAKKNLMKFGDQVEYYIMKDWAHDVGEDNATGGSKLYQLIQNFLNK